MSQEVNEQKIPNTDNIKSENVNVDFKQLTNEKVQITKNDVIKIIQTKYKGLDKEIFDSTISKYKGGEIITPEYAPELEGNIMSDYQETFLQKEIEKRISAKTLEQNTQKEIDFNKTLEKFSLTQDDYDKQLVKALEFGIIDAETLKSYREDKNPLIVKNIVESVKFSSMKSQTLPQASNVQMTPELVISKNKELLELKTKIDKDPYNPDNENLRRQMNVLHKEISDYKIKQIKYNK